MLNASRISRLLGFAVALAASTALVGAAAAPATPDESTRVMREPTNLGLVKNEVKKYYGAYQDESGHYHHSDSSEWAVDTDRQIDKAQAYLQKRLDNGVRNPAVVLDIDDTSEITFGHAADHDFGYDPASSNQAIKNGEFPAINSTLHLANWADQHDVRIYFVTGRKDNQSADSLKNLANEGYPTPAGAFFKPTTTAPSYLPCGLRCHTGEFKAYTRAHIEAQGVTIVLNIGDQDSDLQNGHAERHIKLPNPMYYIP